VPRIGYLTSGSAVPKRFREGLRELGYVEGKNIVIEPRFAQRKLDRFPGLAAELVGLKVDAIVVNSVQGALAARKATRRIPIVFAIAQNPVSVGLVTSFAQPGGNVTGLTDFARELAGKRLELLKETVPKLLRVAVLVWYPAGPDYTAEKNEIELAAHALGLQLEAVVARGPDDLENAFSAMTRANANAFMGLTDTRFHRNRKRIVKLSVKNRLPAVYQSKSFVKAGGLMSYGPNRSEFRRRIAIYVDKILKGAKPAELPVEQPTKFELVINLKTAKQIGLTIPPSLLYRADKVIK
ncbi:MAG: ABC transporter substrate-binding protein, partial [Deltaproteobacteria bacterium]|nr:ABC transporter substrate-binding protein [Deltaproteobacteria bacterium]